MMISPNDRCFAALPYLGDNPKYEGLVEVIPSLEGTIVPCNMIRGNHPDHTNLIPHAFTEAPQASGGDALAALLPKWRKELAWLRKNHHSEEGDLLVEKINELEAALSAAGETAGEAATEPFHSDPDVQLTEGAADEFIAATQTPQQAPSKRASEPVCDKKATNHISGRDKTCFVDNEFKLNDKQGREFCYVHGGKFQPAGVAAEEAEGE